MPAAVARHPARASALASDDGDDQHDAQMLVHHVALAENLWNEGHSTVSSS